MKQRDIAVSIILSLVTCGIYSIYWFIVLTDDIVAASEEPATSGALSLILTIITCNIYGIFWAYKMGQLLTTANQKKGNSIVSDNAVLYLILEVFGFNIINLALMQNEVNKMNANTSF